MCFLLSNGFNMKMRQVPVGRGVSFTGHISQFMIKGHCFIGGLLNQTVFLQSKSTCWIGFRARRHFWSFLFIYAMVTCILTCGM